MDKRTTPKAAVIPGYGLRTNAERITAWVRRKQYRASHPAAAFPLPIFKPES